MSLFELSLLLSRIFSVVASLWLVSLGVHALWRIKTPRLRLLRTTVGLIGFGQLLSQLGRLASAQRGIGNALEFIGVFVMVLAAAYMLLLFRRLPRESRDALHIFSYKA